MQKIKREHCLIQYRNFPLRSFDENENEIFFYPFVHFGYWLKLESDDEDGSDKILVSEIVKLYEDLKVENLVFLGDYKRNWISKFTQSRKDDRRLRVALKYFEKINIKRDFKGGVKVKIDELSEFLEHFLVLTQLDGGFVYYHFLDEAQNILGLIHYSGEVKIEILNKELNELFLKKLKYRKLTRMHYT